MMVAVRNRKQPKRIQVARKYAEALAHLLPTANSLRVRAAPRPEHSVARRRPPCLRCRLSYRQYSRRARSHCPQDGRRKTAPA